MTHFTPMGKAGRGKKGKKKKGGALGGLKSQNENELKLNCASHYV